MPWRAMECSDLGAKRDSEGLLNVPQRHFQTWFDPKREKKLVVARSRKINAFLGGS
jgi:hypothetical protein